MADSGVALLVFLIAAILLYLLFKFIGITNGAAVALALFFSLVIMAFIKTPMSIWSNWGQDPAGQLYAIIGFLASLYIIIFFLYKAFTSREPNATYAFRLY
jgi:surface polysaccharide O-acyltransferase-like enzyme